MPPLKSKSIAIVMDALSTIKPKKDTTVAIMKAAQKLGSDLYYMGIDDLFVEDGKVSAKTQKIKIIEDDHSWYKVEKTQVTPLTDFDIVLMRKDPPVDKRFIHACYMLEQAARNGVHVLNNPSALIEYNEKLFATHFLHLCPKTIVASDKSILRNFLDQHKKIIMKPLDAMGGAGVFLVSNTDVNFDVIWELQTALGTYPVIAQEFLPAIKDGDVRVVVINGKPFEHVLVRSPKEGSIRGNMAAGGTTTVRPINDIERKICETVGETLIQKNILLAGLDIIGDRLIEINITSPTGLPSISKECGIDVAELVVEELLKLG